MIAHSDELRELLLHPNIQLYATKHVQHQITERQSERVTGEEC